MIELVIIIAGLVASCHIYDELDDFNRVMSAFVLMVTIFFGIVSCSNSVWIKESKGEKEKKAAELATPRVTKEFDGCKVWSWYQNDHWVNVTKCGNETSTTTPYSVRSGKHTRTEQVTIEVKP